MNLYITEKPSVARIIKDYLNNSGANFTSTTTNKETDSPFFFDSNGNCIAWCAGHLLRLLDPKEYDPKYASWDETLLPIYPEELKKCTRATTKALYKHLQKQIKAATTVYHLGDPDREGCLIVDEILKQEGFTGTVKRILLNALDETSVQNAFSSIQDNSDFQTMTAAAESRAAIDWLIGINLTRFFTRIGQHSGNAGTLPVGRVKAPVLKLVYDRDMSIEQFVPTTYYTVDAYINGKTKITLEHDDIFEKELADRIKSEIEGKEATVSELEREITNHFITSLFSLDTLQVELNKRHAISPSNTLAAAQSLYEKGYITYPRSDCKYLPDSQKEQAAGIIHNLLSNERVTVAVTDESVFTTDKKPIYNTGKVTAHHAIIPTVKELIKEVLETFSTDEQTVYLEVAKRYLAAHYTKPLVKEKLEATIEVANTAYTMKLSETQVRDEGYKILYIDLLPPEEIYAEEPIPFPIEQGDTFTLKDVFVTDHVTKPPKPFTEGTLLSAMNHIDKYAYNASESQLQTLKSVKGIGTPATRATIISELLDPKNPLLYKKRKAIHVTSTGANLVTALPIILLEPTFTADMEEKLSAIENDSLSIKDIISDTKDFVSSVINNTDVRKYAKEALFNRDHPCPKCHEGYLHKLHSKKLNRDFYKCSYPECNFMCNVKKNGTPDYTICPECKTGFIITRKATKGDTTFEFRACTNYPECKYIEGKNKPQPKGPKCPKCGEGILITRKGEKDGKKWQFKGCSNYPKCDYKEWGSGKKNK